MCGNQKTASGNKNEDADSPTVVTESVFITIVVDAHEGWEMAIFDILGEYLHTETNEDVIMFLEVTL